MLVLSRKKNEAIVINDDITIVVVEICGDKVRLGVQSPPHCPVHRREVFDAIHRPPEPPPPIPPSASGGNATLDQGRPRAHSAGRRGGRLWLIAMRLQHWS